MVFRVLHSADWHIGQTINGWERSFEHEAFFAQLGDLIEEHDVDALVMAGDVYDNQNPSAESTRLLYEVLAGFKRRQPHLTTILTAGNHDPAGRLEAPKVLFKEVGVHAVGMMWRGEGGIDLSHHLLPLKDRQGNALAYCLAIPFPRASDLPGLASVTDGEGSPVVKAVASLYEEAVCQAKGAVGDLPLIVTGHLHVSGADESEGAERRILIGGEHAVPFHVFEESLAYVALGHLHKPQKIGRETIRYSGSPFPLSVSEAGYQHGVNLLEFEGGQLELHRLPLDRPVLFHRLSGKNGLLLEEVVPALDGLQLDEALPVRQRPFVHVDLKQQTSAQGLRAEVDQILSTYPVRGTGVSIVAQERKSKALNQEVESLRRLEDLKPEDLFLSAFEDEHGEKPQSVHLDLFHKALVEVE
ncbi:exonuclease SbcCD subunit D [Flexibacterium corallicola]|uniref:exonuclease SbcCD subunit D n=1 Tax=Flexibacterium corallicola TaxID=3037259 RepID=UPI00286F6F6D|nr:exonuclease SbcCD subunit D [Pseudovibrio sp. M1P-2-3]